MFPVIDTRATGIKLRKIMDSRNMSVKDLQTLLGLSSQQSIYHWLNGICLPSLDNLYAMSIFLEIPMDDIIRGNCHTVRTRLMLFWEPYHFGIISCDFAPVGRGCNYRPGLHPDRSTVYRSIKHVHS